MTSPKKKEYFLSEDEKKFIRAHAEKLNFSVKELTVAITGDPKKDGRSMEGKAVRIFLVEDLKAEPEVRTVNSQEYKQNVTFNLSEEQVAFVKNNHEDSDAIEMAIALFPELADQDPKKRQLSKEVHAINRCLKDLGAAPVDIYKENFFKGGRFFPPKNLVEGITATNKYAVQNLNATTIRDEQKDSIEKMCKNLSRIGVVNTIQGLTRPVEREIYLESFISDTWDKGDITAGEIQQYFDLAGERVHLLQIKKHEQDLSVMLGDSIKSDSKLQYTLSDSIEKQAKNRGDCMKRIADLQKNLEGTRTQRLKEKPEDKVTIQSIIEVFQKEEKRKEFLLMQKKQDDLLDEAMDKMENQDEYISRILGATKSEIRSQQ